MSNIKVARAYSVRITQSSFEYATTNWKLYGAVISISKGHILDVDLPYLHLSVPDEDVPTGDNINEWVSFGLKYLNEGKNLLVHCEAGQNRSVIVASLIEAMFYKRNWWDIVNIRHNEMLKEDPPSNWWPYEHWRKAIGEWLMKLVVRPPASPINPPPFTTIPIEEAIKLAGNTRPDFLGSLYKYASLLSKNSLIVEIGTCRAESTTAMACAIKGKGSRIITIDPVFKTGEVWIMDSHINGPGYVNSRVADVINKLTSLGLSECISICADYSWNILSKWSGEEIDLLFIDGSHYPEDLKADLEWTKFVKPGGFLVVDDWFFEIKETCLNYLADKPFKLLHESTDAPTDDYCVTIFQKS